MIEIKTQLLPNKSKRRSGLKMNGVRFVVLHDTGNPNSTAQNNVTYYTNSCNETEASAHIFVDDKEAIMCIPCLDSPEKAWHVLYNKPYDNQIWGCDANDNAIGVELCYFPNDKTRSLKAYQNYIEIVAYLMDFHKIGVKCSGHEQLDPQRKTDPSNALKYIGKTYNNLVSDITSEYNKLQTKIDLDLIKSVDKLNSMGVISQPEVWNEINKININNVEALIKNYILKTLTYSECVDLLIDRKVISNDEIWKNKTYSSQNVVSLIKKLK